MAARPPRALRRTPEYWHKIRGSGAEPRIQGADTFPVPCHSEASPRPTSSLASARAARQDASIEPRHAYSRALRRPASQDKARPKPPRGHQPADAECTRKPRRMDHLSGEGPAGAEHARHADAHSPKLGPRPSRGHVPCILLAIFTRKARTKARCREGERSAYQTSTSVPVGHPVSGIESTRGRGIALWLSLRQYLAGPLQQKGG